MAELSYVHGASAMPLLGETIGVHFDRTARRFGDRGDPRRKGRVPLDAASGIEF